MNAYDWDKTVFAKDSTSMFFLFCLRRYPRTRRYLWTAIPVALRYMCGKRPRHEQKERFYKYLSEVPDIDAAVRAFWDKYEAQVGPPVMPCDPQPGDVVISAGGEFMLRELCEARGLILIASRINPVTGTIDGIDCWGEEKVRRFKEVFGEDARIEAWYSDSTSDAPMAALAQRAYIVKRGGLEPWPETRA